MGDETPSSPTGKADKLDGDLCFILGGTPMLVAADACRVKHGENRRKLIGNQECIVRRVTTPVT
jgi:hypothetical protein